MVRTFTCVLVVLVFATTEPTRAAPTDPALAAPAQATTPAITPAQAAQVLDVLNDPTRRAAFAATLQAIIKGLPPASPAAKTPAKASVTGLPIPLAPNSLGAKVLVGAANLLHQAKDHALSAIAAVRGLPALGEWLTALLTDPTSRARLLDATWRLALALGCGLAVQWAIGRALRPVGSRVGGGGTCRAGRPNQAPAAR